MDELGEYRIEGVVGAGRIGTVHRAVDRRSGQTVALKVLGEGTAEDPMFRERFRREAELLSALSHRHVVPILDAGEVDGRLYLAMQLVEGCTLKQLIQDGGLEPARAVEILDAIGQALDAAHAEGIVHRDVKPANVLVGNDGEIFLSDFGLARGPSGDRVTSPGELLGTLDYIAPEHLDGDPASPAADVYALACMAVESLTGEVPFPLDNDAAVLYAHVVSPPPRVSERRADLPPALDDVLVAGMAKHPNERPAGAGALIAEIRAALDPLSGRAVAAG